MKNGIFTWNTLLFFIALVLFACKNKTEKAESETTQATSTEIKSAFINGDSIHYMEMGKGDPVVFVHGTLGDFRTWGMQVDTFSKNHRVIVYSRRYAWPNRQVINDSADYSVSLHSRDLVEFLKALNLGPVHLVGHSYGAYIVLITTLEHPELVKTATLGEPPIMPLLATVPGGDTILNNFMTKIMAPSAEAFKAGDNEKAISAFTGGVLGDTAFFSNMPQQGRDIMLANILELRGVVLGKNLFPPVTCEGLKKIKIPVLLLQGERTPVMFRAVINELDKCLSNKEKAILPDASHGLEFENPAEFNKIVLGFIDKY